jgi:soluble lytic murein transglycosylase-like protein
MFDTEIQQAAVAHSVPAIWIKAVIETESNWDPEAYRAEPQINDASYGLMQLLSSTARGLGFNGPVEQLFIPAVNIPLGTKLLGQHRRKYGDDFRRVYSAYNSGRPDLYLTSTQVAANVKRAVDALETYAAEAVGVITAGPSDAGMGLLLMGVLMWVWSKRR